MHGTWCMVQGMYAHRASVLWYRAGWCIGNERAGKDCALAVHAVAESAAQLDRCERADANLRRVTGGCAADDGLGLRAHTRTYDRRDAPQREA